MDKRKIALLACVIVLGLSLIGCGRGSSNTESGSSGNASAQAASTSSSVEESASSAASANSESSADYKANFVGTWDMTGFKSSSVTYDEKQLSQNRKKGMDSYIAFNEDGTANIVMSTQVSKFTWEALSDTEAILSSNTGKIPVIRSDDEIICGFDNEYNEFMLFKKGKARDSLPTESSASSSSASASSASSGEVSVDLKEWLDSYEAFVDEYVEFMKNYQESGDAMSMLSDYTDYMQRYSEFLDKANKLDTSKMSAADYAYYIDVTTRISKKLLEVSGL